MLTRTIFRFVFLPLADPVLGVSPAGLPAVLGFDQKNQADFSDVSPTAFFVPNLGSDWIVGLGSSIVFPIGVGTSIVARCQQVLPFWLSIIRVRGLLVLGCAIFGLLREIQSKMTLMFCWFEDCCAINSTAVDISSRLQSLPLIGLSQRAKTGSCPLALGWGTPSGWAGSRCRCLWRLTTTL